MYGYNILYIKK